MVIKEFNYESAHAALKIQALEKTAVLIDVRSRLQGLGHATEVIRTALDYANYLGLDVWLKAQQNGDPNNGMSNERLVEFYSKFGFVPIKDTKPVMMVRKYVSQGSQGL